MTTEDIYDELMYDINEARDELANKNPENEYDSDSSVSLSNRTSTCNPREDILPPERRNSNATFDKVYNKIMEHDRQMLGDECLYGMEPAVVESIPPESTEESVLPEVL